MKHKKIHFVGIKGVGMTALAIMVKESGAKVSGSDIDASFITDIPLANAGIEVIKGFNEASIQGADLVIATGAHGGKENKEVKKANELGIPTLSLGEALGLLIDGTLLNRKQLGVAIAGTHGKTTTTALIAKILVESKMDPSYYIGTSEIPSLPAPGHFGKGKYVVVEADEYANDPVLDKTPKFLLLHPSIAVITNIEYDHVDIFQSLGDVRGAFIKFVKNITDNGTLIAFGDDPEVKKVIKETDKKVITYGFAASNDFVLKRVTVSDTYTFFTAEGRGADLGEFAIQIMGDHNALNTLAAIIVSLELGIKLDDIKKALKKFSGTKRRFEYKGVLPDGALLYDDYAHHPTEIKKTLATFKKLFPRKKLTAIFQPHTYSRTQKLFEDFLRSFTDADEVIITDIYGSLRESDIANTTSEELLQRLSLTHKNARHKKSLPDVIEYVKNRHYNEDNVVLTMGAGDIYEIANEILGKQKK